jgi:hypothetical protein
MNSFLHAPIDGNDPFGLFEDIQNLHTRHDHDPGIVANDQTSLGYPDSTDRYRSARRLKFEPALAGGRYHPSAGKPQVTIPAAPRLLAASVARPPRVEIAAPLTSTISTLQGPVASISRPIAKSDFSKSPAFPVQLWGRTEAATRRNGATDHDFAVCSRPTKMCTDCIRSVQPQIEPAMTQTIRIKRFAARPVIVPMNLPLQTSTGAVAKAPLVLIDCDTDEGVRGHAYLFAITPAALKPLTAMVNEMAEMLAGDELLPFEIERKLTKRFTLLGLAGLQRLAQSGIDMAAWDALARARGLPLARLLGGAPKPVRAYNSKGLGIMPASAAVEEAHRLLAEGFHAAKNSGRSAGCARGSECGTRRAQGGR